MVNQSEIVTAKIEYEIVAPISSICGRLFYVASLRDLYTGRYKHCELASGFDASVVDAAFAVYHTTVFRAWLALETCEQRADVAQCVTAAGHDWGTVGHLWTRWEPYYISVPDSAENWERWLYLASLRFAVAECRTQTPEDRRVVFALRQITEELGQGNLSLVNLGRRLGVSEAHLGRLFKAQLGLSFHSYLRAERMKRAALLLRSTKLQIKQIAGSVGYGDSSNFVHDFRMFFFKTPREYRKDAGSGIGSIRELGRVAAKSMPA